ncbi:MAG: class I SAM-dependent methyltransferase [Pseudomonadota bacterium]
MELSNRSEHHAKPKAGKLPLSLVTGRSARPRRPERNPDRDVGHAPSLTDRDVLNAYRRWAPVYDNTFGRLVKEARLAAVDHINGRDGSVLEVGVGTGLSLPAYRDALEIVGIDLSPEMLTKARSRVDRLGLSNVSALHQMDASDLSAFEDGAFDTVVGMFVITVVPNPTAVMHELARVCAPGGEVLLVNHFSQTNGARGWIERRMAPFADKLGWHPVFDLSNVTVSAALELMETRPLNPLGLFTLVRFTKR